jgi:phosphate:Na+ symporter
VIFGANIGTCIKALLASIGKPREVLRASVVHVLFNFAGVLVWLPFIDQLAELVTRLSPLAQGLSGTAKLAAESPRQIANAHTVFNVANTLLFLPFAGQMARLVQKLVPDRPMEEERLVRAKYVDQELLSTPSLALDRARLEILHLGDLVMEMMQRILRAMLSGERQELQEIAELDDGVDLLHGQIVTYLGKISRHSLTEYQTAEFLKLMETTNDLENIGDIIETNLVMLGSERIDQQVTISEPTQEVIREFHGMVTKALASAMQAATQKGEAAANVVIAMKGEINRLAESAAIHQARRLVAEEPNRLPAYTVEMDILQNLKRIYYFAKRMARLVVPSEDLRESSKVVEAGR